MYHLVTTRLSEVPDHHFWADQPGGKPNYKRLWLLVMNNLHDGETTLLSELSEDDIPNPSSFQRAVAKEAQARRERAA